MSNRFLIAWALGSIGQRVEDGRLTTLRDPVIEELDEGVPARQERRDFFLRQAPAHCVAKT